MIHGMTIDRLQARCDRLFSKADAIKDWIEDNESDSFKNPQFARKWRAMSALYTEAATISICLSAFKNTCYYPLGPLV